MKSILKIAVTGAALAATLCGGLQAAWYDDVTFKGDMRYRFETIDDASDRTRHRLRLRYGAYGKVNDSIDYGFRLATGSTTDPVSTNQTLGGDSANKAINLDLAYADVHVNDSLDFTFGKMKNPFTVVQKSQLIFDGDFTPEGIAGSYDFGDFYLNSSYFFFDSDRKTTGNAVGTENEGMFGTQLGYSNGPFQVGVAYFDFELTGDNESSAVGAHDYNLLNLFVEYNVKLGSTGLAFYGDYVNNIGTESTAANEDQDSGFGLGVKAKFGSKWKAGIEYRETEKNAVPFNTNGSAFALADSDFGGGKTDFEGFKFSAAYGVMKNTEIAATYFVNEQDSSTATPVDYDRFQFDLKIKF